MAVLPFSKTTATSVVSPLSVSPKTSNTAATTTSTPNTVLWPSTNVELENRNDKQLANKISFDESALSETTNGQPENQLKSTSVLLASPSDTSNQIYSSVFLKNSKAKILPIGSNVSHHLLTPLLASASAPGVALRDSDSILLIIFIGIVVSACVATFILAFLTIIGKF